jgi:hypothetical protein
MGLVTVPGSQGNFDPGRRLLCSSQFHDVLKPEDPTVELWSQPDSPAEQRDKSPVTVTGLSDHLAHVGRRRELLKRMCHGWVKTVDPGKPGNKKRLEDIKTPLERTAFEKLFSGLTGRTAPKIFERGMASSKLVGGHAEEVLRGAREELRANRTCGLRDITHVVGAAGSTNDCVADFPTGAIVDIVEESERVV